jgi:hypothetical protein
MPGLSSTTRIRGACRRSHVSAIPWSLAPARPEDAPGLSLKGGRGSRGKLIVRISTRNSTAISKPPCRAKGLARNRRNEIGREERRLRSRFGTRLADLVTSRLVATLFDAYARVTIHSRSRIRAVAAAYVRLRRELSFPSHQAAHRHLWGVDHGSIVAPIQP